MTKRNRATIGKWLLAIVSIGFVFVTFGQKLFFEYVKSILFGLGAVSIFVIGFYGIKFRLQKLYPVQESDPSEVDTLELSSFNLYKLILNIFITVGSPIGGFLAYKVMVWLSKQRFQLLTGVFVVPIEEAFWIFPAFFTGILFGILIAPIGMKIILRNRYKSFIKYLEIFSLRLDSKKFLRLIVFIGFLIISILIYVGLASYTRFTEEGIYIQRANQLSEEFYSYTQVAKIEEKIRKRKPSTDHTFLIQFTDGRQWRPLTVGNNDIPESYPLIMEFVSRKSGQQFNQVETK